MPKRRRKSTRNTQLICGLYALMRSDMPMVKAAARMPTIRVDQHLRGREGSSKLSG